MNNTTTNNELTTRHDFSKQVRDFFNLSVSLEVIDAVELMVLAAQHGTDWKAMGEELLEAAHVSRHCPDGLRRHRDLVKAWDQLH